MKTLLLTKDEVVEGYRALMELYPNILPLIIWRGWEYAAYRQCGLQDPVLDVGCGDGRFFKLVWPEIAEVTGIDIDPRVVDWAKYHGSYRSIHIAHAHKMPIETETFVSAFANCSLEHMDHLPQVLQEIARCLIPGGRFLFSVVTNKYLEWATLPSLLRIVEEPKRAEFLQTEFIDYHHLTHAHSPEEWVDLLSEAQFVVEECIPIVPELTGRLFLFLDHLWHVRHRTGEVGDLLPGILGTWNNLNLGIEAILRGILEMENDWMKGCGVVFVARKTK